MESVENKIIQQKINSVTDLPDGYVPNLQSKWELLETGLGQRRKKSLLIYFYRVAVAAMLLMIGGAGLYYIRLNSPKVEKKTVASLPLKRPALTVSPVKKTLLLASVKQQRKRMPLQPQSTPVQSSERDTMNEPPFTEPLITTEEIIAAKPLKAKRFTEIDFSDPVITDKAPSETVLASQRFKFKIGSGMSTSAAASGKAGIFGLKKQLN